MGAYFDKRRKAWRYQFQWNGGRTGGAYYPTKKAALRAEEEHKKRLEVEAAQASVITFKKLANEYLDFAKRRFSGKSTYKYKVLVYERFMEHIGGDLPMNEITPTMIEAFLRTRPTNTGYNRHRREISALYQWGFKRRIIEENPFIWIEKMPEDRYIRPMPSPADFEKILLAAGEHRPFLLVLYHSLARVDEILRLRWDDVDFDSPEPRIRLWTRKRRGGGWEDDWLPMNEVIKDTLWKLWNTRTQNEWVFFNAKTKTRYFHRPKIMRSICKQAGVKHYGFHGIRHLAATFLHEEKKWPLQTISKLLRHKSIVTTQRYLRVMDGNLGRAVADL